MFTRLQLYILIGCILVASGIFAVYEFWPRPSSYQSDSSMAASATDEDNTQGTNDSTTATETHRVLPETPLPGSYFKLTAKSHTDIEQTGTLNGKIELSLERVITKEK
jgi:hypothetical protein